MFTSQTQNTGKQSAAYSLSAEARQKIIADTPLARQTRQIELQRQAFIAIHGEEQPDSYRLPESARQKLIANTPLARQTRKIERQRKAFIKVHGTNY